MNSLILFFALLPFTLYSKVSLIFKNCSKNNVEVFIYEDYKETNRIWLNPNDMSSIKLNDDNCSILIKYFDPNGKFVGYCSNAEGDDSHYIISGNFIFFKVTNKPWIEKIYIGPNITNKA
jgi:uncharacterized Fe-S cluster protein YjdI